MSGQSAKRLIKNDLLKTVPCAEAYKSSKHSRDFTNENKVNTLSIQAELIEWLMVQSHTQRVRGCSEFFCILLLHLSFYVFKD